MSVKSQHIHRPSAIAEQMDSVIVRDDFQKEITLCPHCDLVVHLPELAVGDRAACPRCHTVLRRRFYKDPFTLPAIYAACALFMLLLAFCFPFISLNVAGNLLEIELADISKALTIDQYSSLALLFVGLVTIGPIFSMITVLLFYFNPPLPRVILRTLARFLFLFKPWCMAEIFLVGVVVSFVKLMAYGEIGVGSSFIPFCIFSLFQIKVFQQIDLRAVWRRVARPPIIVNEIEVGKTGISQGLRLCLCCHAVLSADRGKCPRCQVVGAVRRRNSLQICLSLLFTSVVLYIPANLLPIMVTTAFGDAMPSTILSGVLFLWEEGSYPVAIIIFMASIMIPVLKIIAVAWLAYCVKHPRSERNHQLLLIYEMVEFVGRWSMIDILLLLFLTALVRMGFFMGVNPDIGAIFFATVVIITMISANMFDPRLIWDRKFAKAMREH